MPKNKKQLQNIQQTAIGDGNVQVAGDNNTVSVNQTFGQKIINVFKGINIFFVKIIKGDAETTDQRNRRIMLNHVENFWVKGILEKSLHGAALLELGIKEDPDAISYPWAIKREANKETLPADKSMLESFQEIGNGRSLLILGAPGSGKTTMLLELTRQLIERAREDVTEPIPVVFNLSSWAENLSLADWLARELNTIYYVPKKVAPTWVKENKMLLLLDGLDEVRQESRDKCVDAINQFRTENGLTSMAVCSRVQDYADLKSRLSFDGAIEIQALTSKQVDEYFKRLGRGLAGIRQVLEKDTVLREMAETPLFLSIMTLAYRDTQHEDILVSENIVLQRKHLFDTYIKRMFDRPERSKTDRFKRQDALNYLSWLAHTMDIYRVIHFFAHHIFIDQLSREHQLKFFKLFIGLCFVFLGPIFGPPIGLLIWMMRRQFGMRSKQDELRFLNMFIWDRKRLGEPIIMGTGTGMIIAMLFIKSANGQAFMSIGSMVISVISSGLMFGLLLGWLFGSMMLIHYCALHFVMLKNNLFPWNPVRFLNYCTDLIFLRRVGGGYIFVHRLLMEHFAAMYKEE